MGEEKLPAGVVALGPATPIDQALENAPVIYFDGAVGFASARGMVSINLYQDRLSIRPEQEAK